MIVREILLENPDLVKFYSDSGFMIRKIGTDEYYTEAIELVVTTREYEETNVKVDNDDELYDDMEDMAPV